MRIGIFYIRKEENKAAVFQILPAARYREVMEGLYQVFQNNHIPWDTVNTGYLDKLYDAFINIEGTETVPSSPGRTQKKT